MNNPEHEILSLVDTDRYPINALETEQGQSFLKSCQVQMAEQGWCSFDGFIRQGALEALSGEAEEMLPFASRLKIRRNIYGGAADKTRPVGDPARREFVHEALQLANDQIAETSLIYRIYHCNVLTEFIRLVQGKKALYISGDEFQALNIVALPPGGWQGWHYDHDECVVTLLLQPAEKGGEFVFIPNSRTREKENTGKVERLLDGDMSVATSIGRGAGTLTIFRGEYSLHSVTRIEGSKHRISAILTYDHEPNRCASDEINIRIYGERVRKIIEGRQAANE